MNLTCLVFGILFIISGILFFFGKLHSRITAWQNMSEAEKVKIPIVKLCRNIGTMISLCGVIFLISGLVPYFKEYLFIWFMIGWLLISGLDVFLIEKQFK